LNRREIDQSALGFGNDLVFDDEDVAGLQANAAVPEGCEKLVGQRVAGMDFIG
jgi:hypothetical protein